MLKNIQKSDKVITPQDAANILGMHEKSGMKSVIEIVDNEAQNDTTRCVYYEGWLAAVLESRVIEQLCLDRFEIFGEKTWKYLNPGIERVKKVPRTLRRIMASSNQIHRIIVDFIKDFFFHKQTQTFYLLSAVYYVDE